MISGLNAVFGGVLRGCGRQNLGAYMNLVGWWGITIPLALFLGLHKELGTWGFWAALAVGTSMQVNQELDCDPIAPSISCNLFDQYLCDALINYVIL